jgi:hypothetical protein
MQRFPLLGKSSLLIKFPEEELAYDVANLSASSFPAIPEWMGIQLILVVDPLYFRQLSRFLISAMQWFVGLSEDEIPLIAELESGKMWINGTVESDA